MKKVGDHLKIIGFVSTSTDYKFAMSQILEVITPEESSFLVICHFKWKKSSSHYVLDFGGF